MHWLTSAQFYSVQLCLNGLGLNTTVPSQRGKVCQYHCYKYFFLLLSTLFYHLGVASAVRSKVFYIATRCTSGLSTGGVGSRSHRQFFVDLKYCYSFLQVLSSVTRDIKVCPRQKWVRHLSEPIRKCCVFFAISRSDP